MNRSQSNKDYLPRTRPDRHASPSSNPYGSFKLESCTPSTQASLVTTVTQSLDSYKHVVRERDHKKALAEIVQNCPLMKDLPNTYITPTLQELSPEARGAPIYVHLTRESGDLQIKVSPQLQQRLNDKDVEMYETFGTEEMRRAMVVGIFKYLAWQCGTQEELSWVSSSCGYFNWATFPQECFDRGFRLINIPASAPYPTGQGAVHPSKYPIVVVNDFIRQFAHQDPERRFGVVNTRHDETLQPFMSKVRVSGSDLPVEWAMISSKFSNLVPVTQEQGATIPSPLDPSCRCNACIDRRCGGPSNRLGLQLVLISNGLSFPHSNDATWRSRWSQDQEVFDTSLHEENVGNTKIPRVTKGSRISSSSPPAQSRTSPDSYPLSNNALVRRKPLVSPHHSRNGSNGSPQDSSVSLQDLAAAESVPFVWTLLPDDSPEDDDYVDECESELDLTSEVSDLETDLTFPASQEYATASEALPHDCGDDENPEVAQDIPMIVSKELLWDIEDLERDRVRVAADEELKRRRADEDYAIEIERKKRRITMEVDWEMERLADLRHQEEEKIIREREEEERRIALEREQADERRRAKQAKEDQESRERLQRRLAAIR